MYRVKKHRQNEGLCRLKPLCRFTRVSAIKFRATSDGGGEGRSNARKRMASLIMTRVTRTGKWKKPSWSDDFRPEVDGNVVYILYARPYTSGARFLHESASFGSLFVFAEATRTG